MFARWKHRCRTSVSVSRQTEGKPIAEIKFKTRKNCRATLISGGCSPSFWEATIFLPFKSLLSGPSKANSINGRQIEPYWITPVRRVVFVIAIPNWMCVYIYSMLALVYHRSVIKIPMIGSSDKYIFMSDSISFFSQDVYVSSSSFRLKGKRGWHEEVNRRDSRMRLFDYLWDRWISKVMVIG